MADENDTHIGARLRGLRAVRGLTLDRLAGQCGLTRGYLSLVERGLKTPSVAALLRMTEALGADMGTLFTPVADVAPNYVLRRHQDDAEEAGAIPLAPGRAGKTMEPFIIRPTGTVVRRASHSGEELIVVLRGEVLIRLDAEEIVLRSGDSLYFSGSVEHSIHRVGAAPTELLVVVGRGQVVVGG